MCDVNKIVLMELFGKMATRKAWHKGKLGWIEIEDW
jgi:hypothetical protein